MPLFFIIFFTLFAAINYYIFIRGWQALAILPQARIFYAIIFVIFSLSYLAGKIFERHLPTFIYDRLVFAGSFWFACILYFVLIIVLLDLSRLINHFFHIYPAVVTNNYPSAKLFSLAVSVILVIVLLSYGFYNSRNFVVNTINIELPKKKSTLTELNIVQISDIHISAINNEKWLHKVIDKINELNPDIVLIPGDMVDERAYYLKQMNIGKSCDRVKTKYGVYASTGNHEYINGAASVIEYFSECGINFVLDSAIVIDNSFYLAARLDTAVGSFTNMKRKPLDEILSNAKEDYPLILLDHTPFKLEEAEQNKVDLQLSGHTHNGQMWPLNWITTIIYEISWGYGKKGNTHYYISSGLGTWGPPVKIGNDAEIVNIKIKFI